MTETPDNSTSSRSILHVFIFATFAIAQPVFDLLSSYPEFFIARHTEPADIWLLIAFLSAGIPALLVLCLLPFRLFGVRLWTVATNAVILLLFSLIVWRGLRLMETGISENLLIGMTVASTGLFGYFYSRKRKLREFISFLFPAVIIFPLLLVWQSPLAKILFPADARESQSGPFEVADATNVVVLVFDEFPVFSLMKDDETIDAEMFPNFHALSESASWYRNATAVADSTLRSVTSIVTGRYPSEDRVWTHTSYPDNLFTLYAKTHEILAYESATDFCPKWVCGSAKTPEPDKDNLKKLVADLGIVYAHMVTPETLKEQYLPALGATWKNFGAKWEDEVKATDAEAVKALKNRTLSKVQAASREDSALSNYKSWLDKIGSSPGPGIYFHHIQLPHKPWKYYPDGIRYYPGGIDGLRDEVWSKEKGLVLHGYQRHLLQVAHADHLLGLLLDRLRKLQLFDNAMIIITADHGASFIPGKSRRILDDANFADILRVPLFIKQPGQKSGQIHDDDAELVDLLPTINKALGVDGKIPLDGAALTLDAKVERDTRVVLERTRDNRIRRILYASAKLNGDRGSLDEKVRLLGSVYAVGGFGQLLGKPPAEYLAGGGKRLSFSLDYPGLIDRVDASTGLVPGRITGTVTGLTDSGDLPYVALGVNGKLLSTAKLYHDGKSGTKFSAMVPENAFHEQGNRISLYLVRENPDGRVTIAEMNQQKTVSKWKPITARKHRFFRDVPNWNAVSKSIYAIANQGITGGCKPGLFCPNQPITRAEVAVFLGKVMKGVSYQPATPDQARFHDIARDPRNNWINLLLAEGIMSPCRQDAFCPDDKISRGTFAKLVLKARYGAAHVPSESPGAGFEDVAPRSPLAPWIAQIAAEGITAGCSRKRFCPNKDVTRADAAVWLVRAFNIPASE
jgi:hypothetical protein